jgi:signal transduction histidine kinase
LKIESRDVSEGVEILFIDNGSGIPADKQLHLFELLADSNKKSGMGLGLWLCQHIVSRHGGHIQYEDAPDGGAQFIVLLLAAKK